MKKEDRKKAPDGTPMHKMSEYEGKPIPKGFSVYIVKDEESIHQDQMFTFDKDGNLELIKPHEVLDEIKDSREIEREIEKESLEQKKIETEKQFKEFLKEIQGISPSEYYALSKSTRKAIREGFYPWLREKRGKDVDWNKRLEESKKGKEKTD